MKQSFNQTNLGVRERRSILTTAILIFFFVVSGAVFCASAEEGDPSDDFVLEDTVVTATKTGESLLQKTPISITALDSEILKNKKTFKISDLTRFSPNTEITQNAIGSTYYIRGVGSNASGVTVESGVAVYLDGVYLERGLGGGNSFFDVERIEILRGPQGTLYGRNATGGAINIITKSPSDELSMTLGTEIGSLNKLRFDATLSGPIVGDKLKARLTVSESIVDGYVKNLVPNVDDLGGKNFTAVRGALEWLPRDSVNIILRADSYETDSGGHPLKYIEYPGYGGGYVAPQGHYEAVRDLPEKQIAEEQGVSGHITIGLPHDFTLRSITGFRSRDYSDYLDWDGIDLPTGYYANSNEMESLSQELQLDGKFGRLNFIIGAFYYKHQEQLYEDRPEFDSFWEQVVIADVETDAYAAFTDVRYNLTEKLNLGAGLRYTYEKKHGEGLMIWTAKNWVGVYPNIMPALDETWTALTPKFQIDYSATDDLMFFFTVANGFRSGMFKPSNGPGHEIVDPESAWSYEGGLKASWLDKRLRTNLALFYIDYTDMQVRAFSAVDNTSRVDNAAKAVIQGAELEIFARPLPALTINCMASYLDATYDEYLTYDAFGALDDVSGNQLIATPKFKFALGAQYTVEVKSYGFLTIRGDYSWSDEKFTSKYEDPDSRKPAYALLDGLIRFETTEGQWSLEVYGKNLLDDDTVTLDSTMTSEGLYRANYILPPRIFGAQLVFSY